MKVPESVLARSNRLSCVAECRKAAHEYLVKKMPYTADEKL